MSQAKLFVVDDDEAARTLLAEALVKEGYEVEAFSSGQAAVERGKQSRADVVLTDIRMEQGDGFLVLKEFKKFSPDTSIVLLTAFGSLEGAIEAIKQGAYDYLAKPFKRTRSVSSSSAVWSIAAWCGKTPVFVKMRAHANPGRSWSAAARRCWRCTSWWPVFPRAEHGAHRRRKWNRERTDCAGCPFEQSASRQTVHSSQLRRLARSSPGVGNVRL